MKAIKYLMLATLSVALVACNKGNIQSDYDTATQFSEFKRFYLVSSKQSTLRDTQITEMELKRVERAIAGQMKGRFDEVFNPLEADIIASYYLDSGKRDGMSLTGNYSGSANSGSWRAKAKEADSLEPELIIDLNSNKSGKMLWRGSVKLGKASKAKPEARQALYETEIAKLLQTIPK
ncbi:DUF4136 domain-containing protein [uncultured Pseudoteredinibacter sp.]|uniref:DUF4136 domain-containing protein n=1 Tax=uncultured Pseudoteredinibacter sp. TaxID=1641701 RepID=UPI0026139E74|nr:DUF4136 domain-containing protein [uncultured Pseudoteredinibacter sp.]